jgi:plasmid stability protein
MSVTLSIKNAPDDVVQRLRKRAERNHRSLQGELLAIIEAAAIEERPAAASPRQAKPVDLAALKTLTDAMPHQPQPAREWLRTLRDEERY